MPVFDECCVLIPAATLEDFPADLSDYDARSMLAGWTVLWHPRLLADSGMLPSWYRADSPPDPKSSQLVVIPAPSSSQMPTDFPARVSAQTDCHIVAGPSRAELIGQIAALTAAEDAESWCHPPMIADGPRQITVDDFYAAGYATLQIQVMTRRLRYTSNLDEIHLQNRAVDAARAFLQGNAQNAIAALHDVFDCLAQERDHYFSSSDPHLIDLTLVTSSTVDAALNALSQDSHPTASQPAQPLKEETDAVLATPQNYLIDSDVAEALESMDAPSVTALKQAIVDGTVGWAGAGPASAACLDGLTLSQATETLVEAVDYTKAVVGIQPKVFGRFTGGVPGELIGQLARLGFVGVIPIDFAEGTGHGDEAKVILESDGVRIEALTTKPIDASSDAAFLTLGAKLGELIDSGEIATALLAHWPGDTSDSFCDLQRSATWGLALGRFWKFEDYFTCGEQPYHHGNVTATSQSSAALLNRLVATATPRPLEQFAGQFCDSVLQEQSAILDGMTDLVTGAQAQAGTSIERFADAIAGRQTDNGSQPSGSPSIWWANPISAGRRTTVHTDAAIDKNAKHVFAVSDSGSGQEATLDLPSCGFVRLDQSTGETPRKTTKRSIGGSWFRRKSAGGRSIARHDQAENLFRLQNEFMEVVISGNTGGVAGVYSGAVRGNRFSMKLIRQRDEVARDPISTSMECTSASIVSTSPGAGVVAVAGQLLAEDAKIGEFNLQYTLRRGSRLLEVSGEASTSEPLGKDPWRNYFAARAAVAGEAAIYRVLVRDKIHRGVSRRLVAPLGVLVDESERQTLVASCGRPFHRRESDRYLDTLLLVGKESQSKFELLYGFDVPSPVAAARSAIAAPPSTTLQASEQAPQIGWIVHLSPKSVYLANLWVGRREDGRLAAAVRLVQTRSQPCKVHARFARDVEAAVALDVPWRDAINSAIPTESDPNRLRVADDGVSIPLAAHGIIEMLVVFQNHRSG